MNIICKKNVDNNYSPIWKSAWPKTRSKLQLKYSLASSMYNLQGMLFNEFKILGVLTSRPW